jgi:mannonate dehydratase
MVAESAGTMKLVSVLGLSLTVALGACAADEGSSSSSLTQEPGNCGSIETHVIGIREGFQGSASVHIKRTGKHSFEETAHPSDRGDIDVRAVLSALHDTGFTGPIRSDHGRMIWGEAGQPGYGLHDRALGAMYLHGLWEGIAGG